VPAVISLPVAATWSGGGSIFGAFLVVFFFALVYGYYTRTGSAINQHPYGDLDHNSGPEKPSQLGHDITQDVRDWDRGVAGVHHHRHRPSAHP
jgi:hypothetical protein